MNNKTIIEVGFRIIWKIMVISEGVIRFDCPLRPLLDLHNSSDDTKAEFNNCLKKYNEHVALPKKIL